MSPSRWFRFAVAACAAAWMIAPSIRAQDAPGRPSQIESPLTSPLDSPIAVPDPAGCTVDGGCSDPAIAPTPPPQATFQAFLPGVAQPDEASGADNQPPGPPPDLGTLLNYVAGGIVVVGVTLKVYWYLSDRRKRHAQ